MNTLPPHDDCPAARAQAEGANALRRAADRARERAMYLEQAIKLLRRRVAYLEAELAGRGQS